eukprot:12023410-Alexandrium_andersonii.AAC.1
MPIQEAELMVEQRFAAEEMLKDISIGVIPFSDDDPSDVAEAIKDKALNFVQVDWDDRILHL